MTTSAALLALAGPMSLYAIRRRPRTVMSCVTAVTAVYVASDVA